MKAVIAFLFMTFIGPLWILLTNQIDLNTDWRTANRASAHIAPDPKKITEAVIQVYSARAFSWRGLFSVHLWLAVKAKNADQFTVYQVIGWRSYHNLAPLVAETDVPDRYWFNQKPRLTFDLRGKKAAALIPKIVAAVKSYPYSKYNLWPGPNSNTLLAYIARQVPALNLALPANAIGKDYLPLFTFFTRAPSNTGYQFSFLGILGILLAQREGLEVNVLGFVYGVNPIQKIIKLPGIGEIKVHIF